MATESILDELQSKMAYRFTNLRLLEDCLVAGDSNSDNREGHRGVAQLGDSLMSTAALTDGLTRSLPRGKLQDTCSHIRSKKFCGRIAKNLGLHEHIRPSERQMHIGLQPTTLKNAVASLIGAVWLDSASYVTVLGVMMSIGLLNHVQHLDTLQETLLEDADSPFDSSVIETSNNDTVSAHDSCHNGEYWSCLENDENALELPMVGQVPLALGSSDASALISSATMPVPSQSTGLGSSERERDQGNPIVLPAHKLEGTEGHVDQGTSSSSGTDVIYPLDHDRSRFGSLVQSSNAVARDNGGIKKRSRNRQGRERNERRRGQTSVSIIATFLNCESKMDISSQQYDSTADLMKVYDSAILQAPTNSQASLATLVTSIGDSTMLLLLKEALEGLRAPKMDEYFPIDRQLSIAERLGIIKQAGACGALLRLVRLLHIVALWEDLSRSAQDGADKFVVSTPVSVEQHTACRGNPLNIARANVARGFTDLETSPSIESLGARRKNTQLRRLGQRLGLIVRTWGLPALLILGQGFSEDKILASDEGAFENLIRLIDQREGARIRAISNVAHPILQDFRSGNRSTPRLRLESADEDAVLKLPRLSIDFESLMLPTETL